MKTPFKKALSLVVLLMFAVVTFGACTTETITLSTDFNISTLQPGESIQLSNKISKGLNEEHLTYTVLGQATVTDHTLFVNKDATVGSEIKVFSEIGGVKSNTLAFVVAHIHINNITLTTTTTTLLANDEAILNVDILPTNATAINYSFSFIEGEEYANINYNPISKQYSLHVKDIEIDEGTKVIIKVTADNNQDINDTLEFTLLDKHTYITSLQLTSDKTELEIGDEAQLNISYLPENATATDYSFSIIEGQDYVDLNYNTINKKYLLKVKDDAFEVDAKVIVQVTYDNNQNVFDTLEFTLVDNNVYITSLQLTSDKTELEIGDEVSLNVSYLPEDATVTDYSFSIIEGQEFVNLNYNTDNKTYLLKVKDDVFEVDAKVIVQVTYDNNQNVFDTLEFTLVDNNVYITSLQLTSNKTELEIGDETQLIASYLPENATVTDYTLTIIEGQEHVSIYSIDNKTYLLKVKNDAFEVGASVIVKATYNNNQNVFDTLEFTLIQSSIKHIITGQDKYFINTKAGDVNPNLNAMAFDSNFARINNPQLKYEIITGQQFLEVDSHGNLNGVGHGVAVVKVSALTNSDISIEREVTVVNPPDSLQLPDQLKTKDTFYYSNRTKPLALINSTDERALPAEDIPESAKQIAPFIFIANTTGNNVSSEIIYTFSDGMNSGNSIAEYDYETGTITFKKTGAITITATSSSSLNGYNIDAMFEKSVSFTVNVNNGFNATDFDSFKFHMEWLNWNLTLADADDCIVNILGDITPSAENLALGVNANAIFTEDSRIIYGNNYQIDLSGQAYTGGNEPFIKFRNNHGHNITVKIYDLEIIGNYGIEGVKVNDEYLDKDNINTNAISLHGYYQSTHGETGELINANIENVIISNVKITGFREGLYMQHVVNGLITDSTISNIFHSAIASHYDIVEISNMTYSRIGGFGLYTSPNVADNHAGKNFDEVSKVKISGNNINIDNMNKGSTPSLVAMGPVIQLLNSGITNHIQENNLNEEQANNIRSHFNNEDNEFGLFSLVFVGMPGDDSDTDKLIKWPNGNKHNEIVEFETGDLMGSIIKIEELDGNDVNTTHKYIVVDVIYALGNNDIYIGQMILINLNYQP